MSKATRVEVRNFGLALARGDVLVNRWQEHAYPAGERVLTVVADVRKMPYFILQDAEGRTTWMRTRTLLERYRLVGAA